MKLFDSIEFSKPKLNKFDLSQEKKLSMNMGELVPVLVEEVLPGDRFRVRTETLVRFAPLLAPIMHRVNCYIHYFFVPNRLLWSEWEAFITGGEAGTSLPVTPKLELKVADQSAFRMDTGSLYDYLGLPPTLTGVTADTHLVSALPFRAYQAVFNEYYRDQNLQVPVPWTKNSGVIASASAELIQTMMMRSRAWEKDYFTSALPFAQRGGSVSAPVTGEVTPGVYPDGLRTGSVRKVATGGLSSTGALSSTLGVEKIVAEDVFHEIVGEASISGGLMSINNLRRAIKLQEWLEKSARAGSRYIETIRGHFGVTSSDSRLQRPEYLGGGRTPVVISEVASSVAFTDGIDTVPQANMAGRGLSVGTSYGFSRSFEEHGFIIGIMSVLPKTAYQQGIPRMFSRVDKFDYYWPEFAHLGEQEILAKELFYDLGNSEMPDLGEGVFGYQSRYAEYKFGRSTVHGDFRDVLSFWHMGRIFSSLPALNESFVTADPTERVFAVGSGIDHLYVQLYHDISALRPMPYFGTPSF